MKSLLLAAMLITTSFVLAEHNDDTAGRPQYKGSFFGRRLLKGAEPEFFSKRINDLSELFYSKTVTSLKGVPGFPFTPYEIRLAGGVAYDRLKDSSHWNEEKGEAILSNSHDVADFYQPSGWEVEKSRQKRVDEEKKEREKLLYSNPLFHPNPLRRGKKFDQPSEFKDQAIKKKSVRPSVLTFTEGFFQIACAWEALSCAGAVAYVGKHILIDEVGNRGIARIAGHVAERASVAVTLPITVLLAVNVVAICIDGGHYRCTAYRAPTNPTIGPSRGRH